MKKLSILVALILCVTVGGVYAAWMYPSNQINEVVQPVSNVMAEVTYQDAYGSYHTEANTLKLTIDQESQDSHKAVIKYEGEITITFTAHEHISGDQLDDARGADLSITGSDLASAVYNGKEIWKLSGNTIDLTNEWTDNGDGTYTCTIQCSDLKDLIGLSTDFVLNTVDEYISFRDVQKLAVFRINVEAQSAANS